MSPEQKAQWLADRCGKLTASNLWKAMSYLRNGEPSKERTRYMFELLAERETGFSMPHVVTDPMLHGQEYEPEAVDFLVYRFPQYNPKLSRFYDHPTILNFGATPDREIGEDGLLEVKCPTTTTFLEWRMAGVVPEKHKPQMCGQLLCTGRKWCGFVAYDPRIRNEDKRLFLRKYEPTPEELARVEAEAIKFLDELEEMFSQYVDAA